MKKAWIFGIVGLLAVCVLSEGKASPAKRQVRYLSESTINKYIEEINGKNPCETLTNLAEQYKVSPCKSCTGKKDELSSCFSIFYKEIKEKYGPRREEYGFKRDEIDEILKQACSARCTLTGCKDIKTKNACEIFCGFANDEGIRRCPNSSH